MTDCKPRRVEAVVYETLDGRLDARLDYRRDDRDDIDYASKRLTEAGFRPGDRVVIVDVAWLADVERELADAREVIESRRHYPKPRGDG